MERVDEISHGQAMRANHMKGHILKVVATAMLWMLCHVAHAGTVTYVYTDPQGTPLAEADASGNITARFEYTPYGVSVSSMGAAPDGPGYTGHVNDPDTGFVYMQARYYDPAADRFLSADPVVPSAGNLFNLNRYVYANDNPAANTDPDGRCPNQSGCTEAIPYSVFRDTFLGRFASNTFGNLAAVFSPTNTNPLNGQVLNRGEIQDAKLGALLLAAPAPARSEVAIANAIKPMARGVASEARVLLDMGLTKNTQAVASAEGRSIPDALTSTASFEIKDAASVSATRQVRIQTDAAKASGRQSVLITGENTHVSGSAAARYDQIIRRADLGPQE